MKKLIYLLVSFLIISCNVENDLEDSINQNQKSFDLKTFIKTNYDGKIFNFDDELEFIALYNNLSSLDPNDFNDFLEFKANNNSSYYSNLNLEEKEGLFDENELIIEGEFMFSDFLLSIFNSDNKIIIGDKVIYLDEKGSLFDYNTKEIFWTVTNSLTSGIDSRAYNVNYTKSWVKTVGARRVFLRIFNETLISNGGGGQQRNSGTILSSKVFYKIDQKKESCSFWRCTRKDHNRAANITPNINIYACNNWVVPFNINYYQAFNSVSFTKQIANYEFSGVCVTEFWIANSSLQYNSEFNHNFTELSYSFDPF